MDVPVCFGLASDKSFSFALFPVLALPAHAHDRQDLYCRTFAKDQRMRKALKLAFPNPWLDFSIDSQMQVYAA